MSVLRSESAVLFATGCAVGAAVIFLWNRVKKESLDDKTRGNTNLASSDVVNMPVGANTTYIISTSGRPSSMRRYRHLLRDVLKLDVAYIPINTGGGKIETKGQTKISAVDFCDAIRGLRAIGGAISKDIKGAILHELDKVDDIAREIGAVNTVVRENNALVGYNTDAEGFRVAIEQGIRSYSAQNALGVLNTARREGMHVKSAVCYGYGGVTSVEAAVFKRMGIEVFITGRRPDAAQTRAEELGVEVFDSKRHSPDLFVNAAPVTDMPLATIPNFLPALEKCRLAFDHELVGKELVKYCTEQGIFHIPGKPMYWPQMEAQWKLFLKAHVSDEDLKAMQARLETADKMALL